MLKLTLTCALILVSTLVANPTVYIDGGGSSTALALFDEEGQLILENKGGSSNLNASTVHEVAEVLHQLLHKVPKNAKIRAGFAGAGAAANREILENVFVSEGFSDIEVQTDVGLLLTLLQRDAILLISGTGSVCFVKKGDEMHQFGGLGRLIGDEGSGYWIGKQAIKNCLEAEQEGKEDPLSDCLREYFSIQNTKEIVPMIHQGAVSTEALAGFASVVLEHFHESPIAFDVINQAGASLADCVVKGKKWAGRELPVYLYGGLFQNAVFCEQLFSELHEKYHVINLSHDSIGDIVDLFRNSGSSHF